MICAHDSHGIPILDGIETQWVFPDGSLDEYNAWCDAEDREAEAAERQYADVCEEKEH